MKAKMTNIHYDKNYDVMYISIGEPTPSYSEELADGIYLRYDMNTDELKGITVMDFSKRINELKKLPISGIIPFDEISSQTHLN